MERFASARCSASLLCLHQEAGGECQTGCEHFSELRDRWSVSGAWAFGSVQEHCQECATLLQNLDRTLGKHNQMMCPVLVLA